MGAAAKEDLNWWRSALDVFHGFTLFPADYPEATHTFATDACLVGGAGHYENDWFAVNWSIDSPGVCVDNINMLELLSVLIAVRRWSHLWAGKHICVRSDNVSTVAAINKIDFAECSFIAFNSGVVLVDSC